MSENLSYTVIMETVAETYWNRYVLRPKWADLHENHRQEILERSVRALMIFSKQAFLTTHSKRPELAHVVVNNQFDVLMETIEEVKKGSVVEEPEDEYQNHLNLDDELVKEIWERNSMIDWNALTPDFQQKAKSYIQVDVVNFLYERHTVSYPLSKTMDDLENQWYLESE